MSSSSVAVVIYSSPEEIDQWCPGPDLRDRCRKAVEIARKKNGVIFLVIGCRPGEADMWKCRKMLRVFLKQMGWREDRIVSQMMYEGTDVFFETVEVWETIKKRIPHPDEICVVSQWYRVFRRRVVWEIVFKHLVRFYATQTTDPKEALRELFVALPGTRLKVAALAMAR